MLFVDAVQERDSTCREALHLPRGRRRSRRLTEQKVSRPRPEREQRLIVPEADEAPGRFDWEVARTVFTVRKDSINKTLRIREKRTTRCQKRGPGRERIRLEDGHIAIMKPRWSGSPGGGLIAERGRSASGGKQGEFQWAPQHMSTDFYCGELNPLVAHGDRAPAAADVTTGPRVSGERPGALLFRIQGSAAAARQVQAFLLQPQTQRPQVNRKSRRCTPTLQSAG
ncbi:unnamed protein product [Arctogadus glacialis]